MDLTSNQRDTTPQIVVLDFFEDFVPDSEAGAEGGLKTLEYVKWQKKGVQTPAITIEKISRLKGRAQQGVRKARPPAPEWAVIEPYYNAWKAGQEMPEEGTPLASWPGCPPALAEALKNFQVRTVEDFIGMPDAQRDRISYPGVRAMVSQAQQFMKSKETKDAVEAVLEKKTAENEELMKMVKDLQDRVEELQEDKVSDNEEPSEEKMRAFIEEKTGKKPHHKLGREKLIAKCRELDGVA